MRCIYFARFDLKNLKNLRKIMYFILLWFAVWIFTDARPSQKQSFGAVQSGCDSTRIDARSPLPRREIRHQKLECKQVAEHLEFFLTRHN